jgi:cellulose synthase operon protein C
MNLCRLPVLPVGRLLMMLPIVLVAGCGSPEQRAQNYYESGMALVAKKDDLKARMDLLQAVKYKSDKVEAWRALAGIDERTGSNGVFTDLRRIVELDPSDLDARLKLARIMIAGGASDAALKVMDVATDGEKPNAILHALRAVALLKTKDSSGAFREAQLAYAIDPSNVDAASLLASKKLIDGDADGALMLLDSLTVGPKDETRISLEKMQIYAKKGDLPRAETLLRGVISLNPKEVSYQSQLIQLLMAQRKFDDAEKEFRARASANPTDSKAALDLVRFLRLVKGPAAAQAELEGRIKAGGDVFDYQIALAEIDLVQNKPAEAVQLLQTLVGTASAPDKKLAAQLKLAEVYVSQQNVAAAEPIIADMLAKDRRNAGALRLRAAINIDKGQLDSAISDLREALNDQPKSAELLTLLAVAYERAGKNELADRQYADALKSVPSPDVALRYVAFLQRRDDAAQAEKILTDVSSRNSNNLQLLSSLAQVRLSRQNWTGALAVADAIGKINDGRAAADQIRASALAGQNKIDESVAALEDAHKTAPDAIQPVMSLISAYVKQGNADKAITLLQDMHKRLPANAEVLVLLGQTQLTQNKEADALQSFKEAVAQQPKDLNGYNSLSELFIRQKNFDAADNTLQTAIKELPGNPNFRLSLAGLQILKGDPDKAIAQYEAFLKDQPKSLVAINNLVSLLLDYHSDKDSLDRAFTLADDLKNSNVPQFQDTFGWAQYKRGDYKVAVSTLEGIVTKLPNLAAVHYHLGMGYAATGAPEKAAEQFKAALALEPDGTALKENIRSAMK